MTTKRRRVRHRRRAGHHVADDARVAFVDDGRGGFADAGMLHERGFDVAELDSEAAQLHLRVEAAEEFDLAVGAPSREIARAVQAMAFVHDEPLGGEIWTIDVAAREIRAADVELARRRQPASAACARRGCESVCWRLAVPMGTHASRHVRAARPERHVDGGFRRAVEVVERTADPLLEPPDDFPRQRLTAAEYAPQRCQSLQFRLFQECLQHRRHKMHRRDVVVGDEFREIRAVAMAAGLRDDELRAVHQRPEQLPHGDVEADGRLLHHDVGGREVIRILHPQQAVADRVVLDHHALRASRGAGREDDVREIGRGRGGTLHRANTLHHGGHRGIPDR